ncbi:MAG TPA: hypothetical protein VN426_07880 [Syntrophomonadaceae bacterium]|nr:hypothetical protein [Syntrophomonadaceae bacterium]
MRGKKIWVTMVFMILLVLGSYVYFRHSILKSDQQQADNSAPKSDLVKRNPDVEPLSMQYMSYEYKNRLVINQLPMLALPREGEEVLRAIGPYTVVKVEDAVVSNDGKVWLYVFINCYDTPINMKGWIKEDDTVAYTKENQAQVLGDITIKAGTPYYESCDDLETAMKGPQLIQDHDTIGYIYMRKDGYLGLNCPGGEGMWVKVQYAQYPPIE